MQQQQQQQPPQVDFSPRYKAHRLSMESSGCDISRLIEFRHDMHMHAEGGFKEFETQRKVREALESYGVTEIRESAGTGLVVDIRGLGEKREKLKEDEIDVIAIRTDIDALPIPENNPHLPYRTKTKFAHMCGHDGHTTILLAAAQVFAKNRDKVPQNKVLRLLVQPAEEGPGGALPMCKEGCMEGVDEVYGMHNMPQHDEGQVLCWPGAVMSGSVTVRITIKGQGGHGSSPHTCTDPISAAAQVINALHTVKSRKVSSLEPFIFSICQFTAGNTFNVFPDSAFMQGTYRYFKEETNKVIGEKIKQVATSTAKAYGCEAEVYCDTLYPPTICHEKQAQVVERLAKQWLGEDSFSTNGLPNTASEDFSYYLLEKPGAFFMFGTRKPADPIRSLHTSDYNFNDDLIATGGYFYLRIIEDRLGVRILQ